MLSTIKTYWGVEFYFLAFPSSVLDDGEWSSLRPGRFIPRKEPPTPIE